MKLCQKCNKERNSYINLYGYANCIGGYVKYLKDECYKCPWESCPNRQPNEEYTFIDVDFPDDDFYIISEVSHDINFLEAMIELKQKDIIEYELKMSQFKAQQAQAKAVEEKSEPTLTCPRCGSTNITEGTKGFSFVTGFIGSGNFRYVCKKCGNKWKPDSMLELLQRANNGH